jgi:predicted  nucleic acid-binding Zn-ribbon protein
MFTGFPCCIQCCIYAYVHREKERERERERDALVCAQIDIDIDIHIDIDCSRGSASDEKLPAARGKKSLQDITSSKGQEARRH